MTSTRLTIAIGDIHGMADTFAHLLQYLEARLSASNVRFILLGDLVDRGPQSIAVISRVIGLFERFPASKLILGNHGAYFRDFLRGTISDQDFTSWWHQGGAETLTSYIGDLPPRVDAIREDILSRHPRHLALLETAVPMVVTDRYCFVHAGVMPGTPLDQQDENVLRWIRRPFLENPEPFEKMVVHGHSITSSGLPEVHAHRIALDAGSYQTARIAAAIFEDDVLQGFVCAQVENESKFIRRFDPNMAPIRKPIRTGS